MNSKSQQDWSGERRKLEWEAGAKSLRLLADRMEKDEIDKGAHWNIQLLLTEDLGKIFAYGKITDQRPPNPDERIAEEKLLKQGYADRDLRLFPGEEWLPTEPGVMSWYEAVRRVKNDPTLRLPNYTDLLWVEQMVKQKPELQSKFKPLERGQFWSCDSEGFDSNSEFACWVTYDHEHYESHISKKVGVNVRFIRRKIA